MNKKFIIGGFLFWAGLSGYMGLRVLESYTEDAVYAVLTVASAKAQEIRYNFLTDDLRLKGIEYDIPDDKVMHKGSIESVEISKFHRKIMLVKPQMPAYDADELPRVGETFKIRGIVDRIHSGHSVLETKIDAVDMSNWHQRIGLVLDHFARKGVGEAFFEEVFRLRMDELSASGIEMKLSSPSLEAPLSVRADRIDVPGGIRAPRGTEKNTPINVAADRVAFAHGEASASVGRVDILGLKAPEPAALGRLVELAKAVRNGEAGAVSSSLLETLAASYGKDMPFGSVAMQNVIVKPSKDADTVTVSSASYALRRDGESRVDSFKCNKLHALPGAFGSLKDSVARFSPEGISLDIVSETRNDGGSLVSESVYDASGLGKLEMKSDLKGDFSQLRKMFFSGDIMGADPFSLTSGIKIQKIKASYSDSGFIPLLFSAVSQETGLSPSVLAQQASSLVAGLSSSENETLRKLGSSVAEQIAAPGEIRFELLPQQAASIQDLAEQLLMKPDSLPLTIESKPGGKALLDHFTAN